MKKVFVLIVCLLFMAVMCAPAFSAVAVEYTESWWFDDLELIVYQQQFDDAQLQAFTLIRHGGAFDDLILSLYQVQIKSPVAEYQEQGFDFMVGASVEQQAMASQETTPSSYTIASLVPLDTTLFQEDFVRLTQNQTLEQHDSLVQTLASDLIMVQQQDSYSSQIQTIAAKFFISETEYVDLVLFQRNLPTFGGRDQGAVLTIEKVKGGGGGDDDGDGDKKVVAEAVHVAREAGESVPEAAHEANKGVSGDNKKGPKSSPSRLNANVAAEMASKTDILISKGQGWAMYALKGGFSNPIAELMRNNGKK